MELSAIASSTPKKGKKIDDGASNPIEITPAKEGFHINVVVPNEDMKTPSSPSKKADEFSWEQFLARDCGIPLEDIKELIEALDKEKYTKDDITQMNNDDLKEMGFPGGHRKKFLAAAKHYSHRRKYSGQARALRGPISPRKSPTKSSRRNSKTLQESFMHTHHFNSDAALDVMRGGQPFVQYFFPDDNSTIIENREVNLHFDSADGGALYWGNRSDFRSEIKSGQCILLNDLLEVRLGPTEKMMFKRAFKVEDEHIINCVAFLTPTNCYYFEAPNIFVLNCYLIGISSFITGDSISHAVKSKEDLEG